MHLGQNFWSQKQKRSKKPKIHSTSPKASCKQGSTK